MIGVKGTCRQCRPKKHDRPSFLLQVCDRIRGTSGLLGLGSAPLSQTLTVSYIIHPLVEYFPEW